MEPRLKNSRKWTALPPELVKQIGAIFKQNFAKQIGAGKMIADGKIFPEEILISIGYNEGKKSLTQNNFEISIAYNQKKDNVLKLLHLAVDAAAALFDQFFTAENDQEFPRIWEEVQFEGRSIYVQYTTTNTDLESEADKILGAASASDGLAKGDWDDDESISPDLIKRQIGVDDDDSDDH